MGELHLWAVSIDEVRDMFGADSDAKARLRGLAASAFKLAEPAHPRTGLLGKVGPLFRHPFDAPLLTPDSPLPSDVDALLNGRYIAPERLAPAWRVVIAWLDAEAWAGFSLAAAPAQLDDLEFDLARAGLSSDFSLRHLMSGDPQLPLRPAPGMSVGYCKQGHVIATRDALDAVLENVEDTSRQRAASLLRFLNGVHEWSARAIEAGRPQPDLVVIWTDAAPTQGPTERSR